MIIEVSFQSAQMFQYFLLDFIDVVVTLIIKCSKQKSFKGSPLYLWVLCYNYWTPLNVNTISTNNSANVLWINNCSVKEYSYEWYVTRPMGIIYYFSIHIGKNIPDEQLSR